MALRAPGVHTHEEWKGMAQPVGLVVEPVVLNRLGIFPESATTVLADWQQRLEQLLEDQPAGEQWLSVAPSFELFCQEVLAWEPGDLRKPEELAAPVAVHLDDYDEVLRPDWVVPEPSPGDGPFKAQVLVQELPVGTPFDALPKGTDGGRSWEATPQQRLERLLKESEHPIGLLWNGVALRMVYAPRGESSGHLTFPLEPMTTVDGRPMLAALQMLLGPDRLFEGGASNTRLRPLMEQSRKEQNEVSTRLAEQVLEALWILLRGFDAAGLKVDDPSHIYGGLITVLLRLVFLLYAEDEELMPTDSLYGQHYSVGGLAQRLRQDRADYQNAMEGRRGAWATLLSLFRLVYEGGGPSEAYLPARHGDLFDPDAYPFLEGRPADTSYTDGPLSSVPTISDDVVEQVLTKLLLLDGQILSYRALDVEQIGSVYEGIMGFMVEKATGPSVGITHRPQRQKITITVVVNAEELLTQPADKRANWLDARAGVKLKLAAPIVRALQEASSKEDLAAALGKRLSPHTPWVLPAGSLILQPTEERRRSGSHYTPRSLTEPIVAEAFRPWLERCDGKPSAEQILALKVCDPAMGSGAFLVALCRFLARWLVAAWEEPDGPGFPPEFKKEWDKDLYARRLIAQRCLYGVDKNPFAVNLAKLSLWLVTLSKELPFTFVDHALKCGDSLVGVSRQEIGAALKSASRQRDLWEGKLEDWRQQELQRFALFHADSRNDADDQRKREALRQQQASTAFLRSTGDLLVAAFFIGSKVKDRQELRDLFLAATVTAVEADELEAEMAKPLGTLRKGEMGITPLHWELEFPDVFERPQGGFDGFVGNPPFIGGLKISPQLGKCFAEWIAEAHACSNSNSDICSYFFRQAFTLTRKGGFVSLLASNIICQGDTRRTGLEWITSNDGAIYCAVKKLRWPGVARLVVSLVCIINDKKYVGTRILNGKSVIDITSYLYSSGPNYSPKPLTANQGKCFQGAVILGSGFTFDDKSAQASPRKDAECLAAQGENAKVIFDFLGWSEAAGSPTHAATRKVINFGQRSYEECVSRWPELINIVRQKVKPQRDRLGNDSTSKSRKACWWQYGSYPKGLFDALMSYDKCIVTGAGAAAFHQFAVVSASHVFSHKLIVFPSDEYSLFGVLQSSFHDEWRRAFGATRGSTDDLTYNPTDVFINFPLPSSSQDLEQSSQRLNSVRSEGMMALGLGLTDYYREYHSPYSAGLSQYEEVKSAMREIDDLLLGLYEINDRIRLVYGYGLDDLGIDELDDEVEAILESFCPSGDLFFDDPGVAIKFNEALRPFLGSKKRLYWRYRWPDAVRDDILARLLALNAEHYEEEVNLGLHSKGVKQASKATSKRKNKSGSSAEFQLTSEPYQTGLKLF